ncbi:MAG: LysR family transcriptional regulator [Polyangiales bacterium]
MALLLNVVRGGSFSAAARALRLPVSSVSRKVAALEEALGVSLVVRTTRSLRLTDAGQLYVDRAGRAVEELQAIHEDLRTLRERPKGRVRITAPVGMGAAMTTMAAPLLARHAELAIEVDLNDARRDLLAEGYDIAVRVGKPAESELVARKLGVSVSQLYASPAYLRRAPRPRELADLRLHRCLANRGQDGFATWQLLHGRKQVRHRFEPALQINEMTALKRAVLEGIGIALLPSGVSGADHARGDLVLILPELRGPAVVWLQFARRSKLTAATSLVIDHCLTVLPPLLQAPL